MSITMPAQEPSTSTACPAGLAYVGFAAFRCARAAAVPPHERPMIARQAEAALATGGVAVRGIYDTSGYRANVDLLVWLVGPSADAAQDALAALRRTPLGLTLDPFWTAIGVHRGADFAKMQQPACHLGEPARRYLCVHPMSCTPEWYLLAADDRRALLAEHGRLVRQYPGVRGSALSAFGLGDHEWLFAFEADDPVQLVDIVRHLRSSESRRYTRDEHPMITGVQRPLTAILDGLPDASSRYGDRGDTRRGAWRTLQQLRADFADPLRAPYGNAS